MSPGRPKWIPTPEICQQAETLAAQGLIVDQIAAVLGISDATVYERQNEYPDFADAIKRGRAQGIKIVTNALFEKASDGDNTAMIFYLKNRAGWNDRQTIEHSGEVRVGQIERTIKDPSD